MKSSSRIKLGVNIDHVATLREARREIDPDPVAAASLCRQAGADAVVIHLRQDRRHIKEEDLAKLCRQKGETHLEISPVKNMVNAALKHRPASVCLVPENPGEITTGGGLNLKKNSAGLGRMIASLKRRGIEVSLFIDPEPQSLRSAWALGADAVELCTTSYAQAQGKNSARAELERLELAAHLAHELKLDLQAGHGLDYQNVRPIARIPYMSALNIGFSIVARSVFVGLKNAVLQMKELLD